MLIRLEDGADVKKVQGALQGLGLWTTPMQSVTGHGWSLTVEEHSAALPPQSVVDVPGVADVLSAPSLHPLVDQQRSESWALPEN